MTRENYGSHLNKFQIRGKRKENFSNERTAADCAGRKFKIV